MRKVSIAAIGTATTIAFTQLAWAADLGRPVYYPPLPPPALVYSWTGFYIGGSLGARWNDVDGSVTSALLGEPPFRPVSQISGAGNGFDTTAFRGGVFGGWNWQFSGPWVVGVEGDAGWTTDKSATFNGSPYAANILVGTPTFRGPFPVLGSYSVKTTWDASARARAGWLATPTILLFATGGAAWLHLDATSNCQTVLAPVATCAPGNFFNGTLGPAVLNDSTTRTGWTVGGGIEALLGGNWLVRAEYRYADFGTVDFTDVRTCTGCHPNAFQATPLVVSNALRVVTHTAMVGLAYKFGP
jgi:outer membrane immunogenic protein